MDSTSPDPAAARLMARLDTMPVIEQAKGIVMEREGCGPDEAFDLLRRVSQRANLKVHVLAVRLVEQVAGRGAGAELTDEQSAGPGLDGRQQPRPPAGTAVIMLPGELTSSNAEQVKLELAAAFEPDVSTVIADGTPTVFCDSAGVRELVIAHKHAIAAGAAFRVVVSHNYLRDRLIRTGLAAYLPVYATLGDALLA
jgi:anti-anti-sigma factor